MPLHSACFVAALLSFPGPPCIFPPPPSVQDLPSPSGYRLLAFTHSRLSVSRSSNMTYECCTFASPFRRLPLTGYAPPSHRPPLAGLPPNNFSSVVVYLATAPAPFGCHALFALLVKFNVKSIGQRKTPAAIEVEERKLKQKQKEKSQFYKYINKYNDIPRYSQRDLSLDFLSKFLTYKYFRNYQV